MSHERVVWGVKAGAMLTVVLALLGCVSAFWSQSFSMACISLAVGVGCLTLLLQQRASIHDIRTVTRQELREALRNVTSADAAGTTPANDSAELLVRQLHLQTLEEIRVLQAMAARSSRER